MSPGEARVRVSDLLAMTGDPEAAHWAEDSLRADILAAIAAGSPDAVELASIAVGTEAIDFTRWYA